MKTSLLLFFLCFSISGSAQVERSEFFKTIGWLNNNPVPSNDKKLIFSSADLIRYQMAEHPDFFASLDFLQELEPVITNHKYGRYFEVIYTYNQLAYALKNKKESSRYDSALYSLKQLLNSYKEIVEEDPKLRIEKLDRFHKMSKSELRKELKNYI